MFLLQPVRDGGKIPVGADILEFQSFYDQLLGSAIDEEAFPPAFHQRYRITACLCETDDKRVYLVARRTDGVVFILKGTTPQRGDSAAREAELLLALDHPGIPKAVETFAWQGWDYLVRQYFEGRTLDDLVAHSGPLPAGEVLRIGGEVAGSETMNFNKMAATGRKDGNPSPVIFANRR